MDISIVIPLFNEAASLTELYEQLTQVLSAGEQKYEIIFVDDGSRDDSFQVLERLHQRDARVKIIRFRKNYGKAAALNEGFGHASGQFVFTLDADLQDDPREIPPMLARLNAGFDMISGWKKKRYDPLTKRLPSKLFNWTVSKAAGIRLHDFNCGLKAYRQEVVKSITLYGQLHRFIPMLAHWEGYRVGEIVVQHHPRKYGKTKYGPSRFTSGFFDLITILFLAKFKKRPLHLFGIAGLISFVIGLGISLYLTFERIFFKAYLSNRPVLFLGILMIIVGIQFVSIGLLGEMITETQKERQAAAIQTRLGF
ncbi:glycosyltransferase family 2 protein [candidate division KSB1 bacterium]|nr:glycosyltransferase family 2 protein [candidate division KSB1 bacterium]